MGEYIQLKYYFGHELAELLADKITRVHPNFAGKKFVQSIRRDTDGKELKARVAVISDHLNRYLSIEYPGALQIFTKILGPENENETGMFKQGYWLMPIARYVEDYGLEHFKQSISFIEELTKRHTGEYAIRPFLTQDPEQTLEVMQRWSTNRNFHVRRLASEGLRPRLPWAKKVTLFSDNPHPVFNVLENLKSDPSGYVRKSVANNLNDFLKENYDQTFPLIRNWAQNASAETLWIIRHALRNQLKQNNPEAIDLLKS